MRYKTNGDFSRLKIRVQGRISEIENADYLKQVLQEIWTAMPQHYKRSLYARIPKRIRSVIKPPFVYTSFLCLTKP